jgi:hypothetical protein
VAKGIIKEHMLSLLIGITFVACVVGALLLHIIERAAEPNDERLMEVVNNIWLLSVTQMTIGYGELVP